MKILKLSIVLLLILSTFSFITPQEAFESNLLQVGESISFSNKPKHEKEISTFSMEKGAFDGSGFYMEIDTGQNIHLRNITQSNGPKQDEFIVIGCTGSVTRNKDNVIFKFEKCRRRYYLIDFENSKLIDTFDSIIQLSLKSTDLKRNPAEFYCSEKDKSAVHFRVSKPKTNEEHVENKPQIKTIHLTSVPANIKEEDLFTEFHEESTLAYFSSIELLTSTNRKVSLPPGNYILCEGNSFELQ